jgi:hypothetical protein
VSAWLGPHRFHGTSSLQVLDPNTKTEFEQLKDETAIDFDGQGYRATLDNSREYGRHAWFVDGVLYLRPRFGAYHKRAPTDGTEAPRIRDEMYATAAGYLAPFQNAMKVSDGGQETVAGQVARKVLLSTDGDDSVRSLAGMIYLDEKTGVPLKVEIAGAFEFEQEGKKLLMRVEARHEFSDIHAVPKIGAPTDAESLPTPERSHETDDRNTLLRGIAPPARRSPTPETVRPEGSPS